MRAGAHAAWAAPAVALATAVPARAAGSGGPLSLSGAAFYLVDTGTRWAVCPTVTVHNGSAQDVTGIFVCLTFDTAYFRGVQTGSDPALPDLAGTLWSDDGTWQVSNADLGFGDSVSVLLYHLDALGPGESSTVGRLDPPRTAFEILWADDPATDTAGVTSIPLSVFADGVDLAPAGAMVRVDAPSA